jgi:hypothetical protein
MVNAKEFFNSATNKQTATQVANARFVRSGESAAINMGIAIEARVEEDSWYVPMSGGGKLFDSFSELEEHVITPQNVFRFDLPQGAKVKKIQKDGSYVANFGGLRFETSAPTDGHIIKFTEDSDWKFFPELLYQALFGDQEPIEENALVAIGDEFKCVILKDEVTFQFIAGAYTAQPGMVLYENADDEDGYTVVSSHYFLTDYVILK